MIRASSRSPRIATDPSSIRTLVADLFEVDPASIAIERIASSSTFVIDVGRFRLVVDERRDATTESVCEGASRALANARAIGRRAIPIVVVPFIGRAAASAARREGVGILDLAGNASIRSGSVYIRIEGRAATEPRTGRPADPFASRARRLTATLIDDPSRSFGQRELAREAGLDEGRTSRLVRGLVDAGYLEREPDRRLRLVRRDRLVEAYRDAAPFERELVRRGVVAARSNEAVVRAMRELLAEERIRYAATGVLGAHAYLQKPAPKLATFYVERMPSEGALTLAGYSDDERRANVWLVVPRDARVLERTRPVHGIDCAPIVDVYADLASHPDPDEAIARELRALV